MKRTIFTAFFSMLCMALPAQQPKPQTVPLSSFSSNGEDSQRENVRSGRQSSSAWITTDKFKEFFLKPTGKKWPVSKDGEIFMQLVYLDVEYGRIRAEVEMSDGKKLNPARHTQIYMLKTGQFKTAYFKFKDISNDGIKHIKIRIDQTSEPRIAIIKAAVSNDAKVFGDGYFLWLLEESWRGRYKGPVVEPKDNTTIKGKVMGGYQAWFRTPNDVFDSGWFHWGNIKGKIYNIDGWPYQDDYPQGVLDKACDIKTTSGKTAYLFSSARPEVAITHFKWMQKYNIDGVWLQRFLSAIGYAYDGREEWILGCIREAANRTGRLWAVEYDASGGNAENRYTWTTGFDASGKMEICMYEKISTDWKWLVNDFGILEDKCYAREGGKPAVFVWGMELRDLPIEECDRVVRFFKNDPKYGNNYFIGGMSHRWKQKPDWFDHLRSNDAVLIWGSSKYEQDAKEIAELLPGVEYYPMVKPGFSWANMRHYQTNSYVQSTDREDGAYMERTIKEAMDAGAKMLFVGMIDEYDEATQILPLSDDPPPLNRRQGAIVFYGKPKNWDRKPPFHHKQQIHYKFDGKAPDKNLDANDFFMNWECSIEIPADGEYKFWVEGPEGDSYKLRSSTKQYVNEQNMNASKIPQKAAFDLKKGFLFPIQIEYWHKGKQGEMQLMWEGPKIKSQPVPMEFHQDVWGRFPTNNGKSPFLYLEITAKAKQLMRKNLD